MPDHILVLADAADHIAVHNLHMIDIKEQFHVRRIHLTNQLYAVVHIFTEISGVPFHRMTVITRVKMFEHEIDFLFLRIRHHRLPSLHTITRAGGIG